MTRRRGRPGAGRDGARSDGDGDASGDEPAPAPRPSTTRSLDAAKATHALLPRSLRRRALAVDCGTDRTRYAVDDPVRVRLTVRNRLPAPLRLRTVAPVPWTWSVDGLDRASRIGSLPERAGIVRFGRRETRTFEATWYQRIRVAADEWVAADPGEHSLGARLLVGDDGLAATTTIRIE
jgi:hypothetical protein